CIFRKTTRLDRLRESKAQILWGMYNKKNVDYEALLWEDFMYQANNREIGLARKEHMPYPRFTKVIINHFISKDKTISMMKMINLHTIRDDSLLDIKYSNAYKTYYHFATRKVPPKKAKKYKKIALPLRKLSPIKEAEPVKKGKRVKRPAKKSTTAPTAGVAIRDTPGASVSKKKAPAKADRSKGLPDEQQRKTSGTDKGTDDNDDDSDDNNKGDEDKVDSDDDGNSDADDNERIDSYDDDENPSFTLKDYDKEEHDEEYESDDDYENMFEEEDDDDLYKDVDVRSLGIEHEKERQGDEEMTDADQNKTDDSKQSSSVSFDFASKFLILENVPPAIDEVASMMYVKSRQEESSNQAPSLFTVPVTAIPETATAHATTSTISESLKNVVLAKSYSQLQSTYEAATSLIEFLDKDLFDSYGKSHSLKRSRDDKDKDEDPPAGSDQCLSKGTKSQPKSSGKFVQAEEPVFETVDTEMLQVQGGDTEEQPNVKATPIDDFSRNLRDLQLLTLNRVLQNLLILDRPNNAYVMHNMKIDNLTQEILIGPAFNLLKGTCKSFVELEYHFEECYKAVTDQLDKKNPEGHEYLFDLSKPLSLIEAQGKTKDARYDNIEGIKDMVPELWSPVKGAYDKFAMWDLLLLLVQKKLSNLEQDVIIDLNVALRMFTRCIVILKWVEDLQLGVKSYQKKLNIIKPETFRSGISKLTPYTAYKNPQVLHDIASNLRMDYLPKRKWSNLDRTRSHIMIKAIDQQLFERRLMRNLEKFVRGREYGNDFRLLERTI
ncbi:hypothetical protein Tco_1053727, partial [Tanacetum coccineum]